MKPEKHKVSLVVEGRDLPTHKLGVVWEEGGEHTADAVTQAGAEVVQDHLRGVFRRLFAPPLWMVQRSVHSTSHQSEYIALPLQKVPGCTVLGDEHNPVSSGVLLGSQTLFKKKLTHPHLQCNVSNNSNI